jgi:hypothetical protein
MSYMSGVSGPVFYNAAGKPITSIACGEAYTFDVAGHTDVWLRQYRNGKLSFDGVFSVPMPSYKSSCANDPGVYLNEVYDLSGSQPGALIGKLTFTVTAGGSSMYLIGAAAVAAFLFMRKR